METWCKRIGSNQEFHLAMDGSRKSIVIVFFSVFSLSLPYTRLSKQLQLNNFFHCDWMSEFYEQNAGYCCCVSLVFCSFSFHFFSLQLFSFYYFSKHINILLGTARMFWICVSSFVPPFIFLFPTIHLPFDTCTMHFIRLRCCIRFLFCCCCWNFRNNMETTYSTKHTNAHTHTYTPITYKYICVESWINWFGSVLKIENATIKHGIMISFENARDKGLENMKWERWGLKRKKYKKRK